MCTVTFIPTADKFYLTSNRDEKSWRKQALPPRFYFHNDVQLIYPRDEDAGGTWIAANKNGNAAVLLNGAFEKHISMPPYRKSRGLVLLDVIKSRLPLKYFLNMDLQDIEPFTLVLFEDNNLCECRWDGDEKYFKQLENFTPHIWSSATLYSEDIISKREEWFYTWLNENKNPTQKSILNFHCFAGDGDKTNDLLMNREDKIFTVSVTSIELNAGNANMQYFDLKNKEMYLSKMELNKVQYEYHA
jgi:hypothetical protein